MIDIKFLRENPDIVKENIKKKFQDKKIPLVDEVIKLDKDHRAIMQHGDELRNRICARLIEKIYDYYNDFKNKSFMTVYKEKSMLIGQTVYIVSDDTKEPLKVLDVSDNAELIVEHKDGRIEKLSSGEVSVRPL